VVVVAWTWAAAVVLEEFFILPRIQFPQAQNTL
jgi:hypothetical protein